MKPVLSEFTRILLSTTWLPHQAKVLLEVAAIQTANTTQPCPTLTKTSIPVVALITVMLFL